MTTTDKPPFFGNTRENKTSSSAGEQYCHGCWDLQRRVDELLAWQEKARAVHPSIDRQILLQAKAQEGGGNERSE
jgi:hypothetical protein